MASERKVIVAFLLLGVGMAGAQEPPATGYWRGVYEVRQFFFSKAIAHDTAHNRDYILRSTDLTKFDYSFYQNPDGVVRADLTRMNRNRSVEGPYDVAIMDFARGTRITFDKRGKQAVEAPVLPPGRGQPMGRRTIMGIECDGVSYRWEVTTDMISSEQWTPRDSTLRLPLLTVEYRTDTRQGALADLWLRIVTKIEESPQVPASLFAPPPGLELIRMPYVSPL